METTNSFRTINVLRSFQAFFLFRFLAGSWSVQNENSILQTIFSSSFFKTSFQVLQNLKNTVHTVHTNSIPYHTPVPYTAYGTLHHGIGHPANATFGIVQTLFSFELHYGYCDGQTDRQYA